MAGAAAAVASFYWQFTGVLNQDVPLDEHGNATEFARYVRYFIERKPHFQNELALPLSQMIVATYLEAIEAGLETRAHIRKASYRASELARRTKPLAGISLRVTVACDSTEPGAMPAATRTCSMRDIVDAVLLENAGPLVKHFLGNGIQRDDREEGCGTVVDRLEISAPNASIPQQALDRWANTLKNYLAAAEAGGDADERRDSLEALRTVSTGVIRPKPDSQWQSKLRDGAEAAADATGAWLSLAKARPAMAIKEMIREIRALPRLIPSAAFLIANSALFFWIMGTAIAEVETIGGVLAILSSVIASLWITDAFTYAVHLERDGWGDSTVARAFQDHHDVPEEVGLWTVRRSVGTTGMMILIPMVLLALAQPHFTVAAGAGVFLMGILFATQTHRWAHAPAEHVPGWVAALQKRHLMISAEAHAVHHDNLDRSWGIFNGWSNDFLDRLGYHQKYTRLRARLFGEIRPLWESQLRARAAVSLLHGESLNEPEAE